MRQLPLALDAIIVFGGEDPVQRTRSRAAVLWYRRMERRGLSPWLIVSGGVPVKKVGRCGCTTLEAEAMRQHLVEAGVPASRIVVEDASRNTLENVLLATVVAHRVGAQRIGLLTDQYHAWRCQTLYRLAWGTRPAAVIPTGERHTWWRRCRESVATALQALLLLRSLGHRRQVPSSFPCGQTRQPSSRSAT